MKFAILSLAAAAALTLTAGTASAQWGHYHGHDHHGHSYRSGHLDYHNGHYHYHNGYYRSGPLYPAYPTYGYGYNPGVNQQFGRFGLSVGNSYYSPYRSSWGYSAYPW